MTDLYAIVVSFVGVLPTQWEWVYIPLTVFLTLMLLRVLLLIIELPIRALGGGRK